MQRQALPETKRRGKMRKYKEIKRKEVIYELDEWELIKKWAARFNITTSEYIRQATLTDKVTVSKVPGEWTVLINELKKIGVNINQLAKKANEINSIYAADYEIMKGETERLCRMLNAKLSTLE